MNTHQGATQRRLVPLHFAIAFALSASGAAQAYNSEEHKLITDRAMAEIVVDPSIVFPTHTGFVTTPLVEQRQMYWNAKDKAVGFHTNNPGDYDAYVQGPQDNSYWIDRGFLQGSYNQVMRMPDTLEMRERILLVQGRTHADVRRFTLGELVALYGDYRRTTYCTPQGHCYLLNSDYWTLDFREGTNCYGPFNCGWRPAAIDMGRYLQLIASGLVPPFGANVLSNTAGDFEYDEAGWWGDEMLRIAQTNDWHFSSAAVAWYTGMHRLAALYVDSARIHPEYWNHVFHYEANALHSFTDLFAFGHIVTNRDETSYGIMADEGLTGTRAYRWQLHALRMGGGTREGATADYYAGRVRLSTALPPVSDTVHDRSDFLPSYAGNWGGWALWEKGRHGEFNAAGAQVRNLRGELFTILGDEDLFLMDNASKEVMIRAVRASVQSLLDAYVTLENGATLEEITSPGSALFAALKHLPVYVENDFSNYFDGMWTRYAAFVNEVSGADVVPSNWADCLMPYMGGSNGYPSQVSGQCTQFPVVASVEDDLGRTLPEEFSLSQNAPNPFNPSTVIEFSLTVPAEVMLDVVNVLGRKVRTLVVGSRPAGTYHVVWDGRDDFGAELASGMYLYRLQAGERTDVRKLLLLR